MFVGFLNNGIVFSISAWGNNGLPEGQFTVLVENSYHHSGLVVVHFREPPNQRRDKGRGQDGGVVGRLRERSNLSRINKNKNLGSFFANFFSNSKKKRITISRGNLLLLNLSMTK